MTKLSWDGSGQRFYETGVDRGVLYLPTNGIYNTGVAWNGLTAVTESPSGAEATPQYADNIKYLNLMSAEEFGATIEAYTYPDEFAQCDGTARPAAGLSIGQQTRKTFGFAYRTKVGNDVDGVDYGYKIHIVYGAVAAPSEKAYSSINDSPEALTFSWEIWTTPVDVPGYKPSATMVIESKKTDPTALAALEDILYGTAGADPRLPLPAEVISLITGARAAVTPTAPTFVASTGVITIPVITGVTYRRTDTNAVVTGTVTIPTSGQTLLIQASPNIGYVFPANADDDWSYTRT